MNTIINLTLALVLSITGVTVLHQEQDSSIKCAKSTKIIATHKNIPLLA